MLVPNWVLVFCLFVFFFNPIEAAILKWMYEDECSLHSLKSEQVVMFYN